jgi:hypothetical protein
MRLSLRTLLAFEDNIFEHEQRQQLERVIPQHDAASRTLNRIRNVMRHSRLGVPGLIGQREELDPNLVAEYLDHQMSEAIQERFEIYCLSSDKYLAEVAAIHTILSNVLGEPARTSRECRLRCYDLYRQPAAPTAAPNNFAAITAADEQQKAIKERESFINASRQLFDDYLQSPPLQKSATLSPASETSDFLQCPVSFPAPAPISIPVSASNRPELIPFPQKNESVNSTDPQTQTQLHPAHQPFSIFPPPAFQETLPLAAVVLQQQPSGISGTPENFTGLGNEERKVPSVEEFWSETSGQPKKDDSRTTAKNSFVANFWNWLTTAAPETRNIQKIQKTIPLKSLFLILLLLSAGLGGWNLLHRPQRENNTGDKNILSVILPEKTPSESASAVPLLKKPEIPKTEPKQEEPKPELIEKTVGVEAARPPVLPSMSEAADRSPDIFMVVAESSTAATPKTEPTLETALKIQTELPAEISDIPVVTAAKEDSSLSGNDSVDKSAFIPNPIRSEKPDNLVAKNKTPETATAKNRPQKSDSPDPQRSARSAVERTFAGRHDVVRIEPEMPVDVHYEIPSRPISSATESSKLLLTPPEQKSQQWDDEESIIAFQPVSAQKRRESGELPELTKQKQSLVSVSPSSAGQPERSEPQFPDIWTTSVANHRPFVRSAVHPIIDTDDVARGTVTTGNTVLAGGVSQPLQNHPPTPSTSNVIMVGEIRESNPIQRPHAVGRVLSAKDPCVLFSASSASEQWEMKRLPLEIYADQYLLTTTPFRTELELDGGFHIEMVGDSKLCVLKPDENGVPGIFIDYGRLVIRPIIANHAGAVRPLRIQTEKVQGIVRLIGTKSLIFVDTFAEIVETSDMETTEKNSLLPKTRPILGLLPDLDERISWQITDFGQPLVATRQAGILLVPEKLELGKIQGLPNWLNRLPLPQEGEALATVCRQVFDETGGNCELALNRLIRDSSIGIRSFGHRLWGDLGRFDVPLSFLSESAADDEPIRQMLIPYFREVMKRDEETVQRLADAIEAVRR